MDGAIVFRDECNRQVQLLVINIYKFVRSAEFAKLLFICGKPTEQRLNLECNFFNAWKLAFGLIVLSNDSVARTD